MPEAFSYGSYDSGMVSNGEMNYSDSYYDVPKNFTSPEWYSPDVNMSLGGPTAANVTPNTAEVPRSVSSFIGNSLNKALDATLSIAVNRFGRSTQPTTAQGGMIQSYTGNPNTAPGNLLNRGYESVAQPNQQLPALNFLTGSTGIWLGLAALALLLLFAKGK